MSCLWLLLFITMLFHYHPIVSWAVVAATVILFWSFTLAKEKPE